MGRSMTVLLTGATGFLGEYLLAELLERGHSVWCLYRSEPRKLDTIRFLSSIGLPRSADRLHWFQGEILDAADRWQSWCQEHPGLEDVDTLLNAAASTRLHLDAWGEPLRTNLGSAKVLRKLVEMKPMQVHLFSTAYVCGLIQGKLMHEVNHPRGDFVNVYEESKWEAEQIWMGDATILRPAVIVGHSETGRCSSFSGWYILFQAVHLLDRLIGDSTEFNRHDLRIDIPADPEGTINMISVDWVAKAAVRIIESPENHNKIFHLTHPSPPTHQWTLDLICRRFNLDGFRFTGVGAPFTQPRNRIERMVWRQMQTILLHFSNDPLFDRTNTERAVTDLPVPAIDEQRVHKLIDYAVEVDWGQSAH
jgi:nucleoside-diphosphate-sugar epimerase